jgi:hypothetical protein
MTSSVTASSWLKPETLHRDWLGRPLRRPSLWPIRSAEEILD